MRKVAAVDKHAVKTHEECSKFLPRPGVPASSSRRYFEHPPFSRGVIMMPGLLVLTCAPRFLQRSASTIRSNEFPRFKIW
jgi:hypothetical protein